MICVYILDLNVLNIIDGSHRDGNVQKWLSTVDETDLYLGVITPPPASRKGRHENSQAGM